MSEADVIKEVGYRMQGFKYVYIEANEDANGVLRIPNNCTELQNSLFLFGNNDEKLVRAIINGFSEAYPKKKFRILNVEKGSFQIEIAIKNDKLKRFDIQLRHWELDGKFLVYTNK